ncbi:MAG: hypothetical protein H6744_03015 [Deltaproteobacteria bacterium]|nr:hypothetical protein [Deltaproteobacteria bacterium]MCB9785645.1 hypothetical protein [Deltaproteobacteria bacterium]
MKGAVLDIAIGLAFLMVLIFGAFLRPKDRSTPEAKARDTRMRLIGGAFLLLAAALLAVKFL